LNLGLYDFTGKGFWFLKYTTLRFFTDLTNWKALNTFQLRYKHITWSQARSRRWGNTETCIELQEMICYPLIITRKNPSAMTAVHWLGW
jgi:hypothetical protein